MEDRFAKYLQLSFNLILTFLGFIVSLLLLLLGFKYIFKLLDYIPWFVYLYVLFIILVPTALFITIFIIYFKRTKTHPSVSARAISYTVFAIALIAWGGTFFIDLFHFFKTGSREISTYYSYDIILLVASVSFIFLIGVMQALTTTKEKDWMEKRRERELVN
jgi:hypothetical protein